VAERLRKNAMVFIELGEGSMVTLLTHTKGAPPAVVLVGSEGGYQAVAPSLERFLLDWAQGKSGVDDLDPEPEGDDAGVANARPALNAWLKKKGVTAPAAKKLDIDAWLGMDKPKVSKEKPLSVPPPIATRVLSAEAKVLPPKMARLASFVGRRSDDAELVAFVGKELKQKIPVTTTRQRYVNVSADEAGVELQFTYEVGRADTPVVATSSTEFLSYLTYIWIREPYCEAPLGLSWKTDAAKIASVLGPPLPDDEYVIPTWHKTMGDVQMKLSVSDAGKRKDQLQLRLGLLLDAHS
jgi:hypothetical protein